MFLEQFFEPRDRNVETIEAKVLFGVFKLFLGNYSTGSLEEGKLRRGVDRKNDRSEFLDVIVIYESFLLEKEGYLRVGIVGELRLKMQSRNTYSDMFQFTHFRFALIWSWLHLYQGRVLH